MGCWVDRRGGQGWLVSRGCVGGGVKELVRGVKLQSGSSKTKCQQACNQWKAGVVALYQLSASPSRGVKHVYFFVQVQKIKLFSCSWSPCTAGITYTELLHFTTNWYPVKQQIQVYYIYTQILRCAEYQLKIGICEVSLFI